MTIKTLSEQRCFGGVQGFYTHHSDACNGEMRFGVFTPPQARNGAVPVLIWLAGLTCNEETFSIKAGAQRLAAELGLMLVTPDTSPRGRDIQGGDDDWDLGTGAGFYLDASEEPWATTYNMETYVTVDLQAVIAANFPTDLNRQGIFGHSMGGHGAMSLHLHNPALFKSVSAFAPICAPMECPWGHKAFSAYLGASRTSWARHDSCSLMRAVPSKALILVDQGLDDQFLQSQLHPDLLESAARDSGQKLNLRYHKGYDHSYYFIQSFVAGHLHHHAEALAERL